MRSIRAFVAAACTVAATIVIAACGSDLSTQPAQDAAPTYRLSLGPSPLGHFDRNLPPGQYYATVKFTIDPNADAYIPIGPHYIYIPAHSVCVSWAGYGSAFWDVPCVATTEKITVTASATVKNNHPFIDFDKQIRFRPNKDAEPVMLYMRDDNASQKSIITYCSTASSAKCVNETGVVKGINLGTRFDPKGLYVYRRIQHFSGYNVTGGRDCDNDCGDF
jgi:hypothetical protein